MNNTILIVDAIQSDRTLLKSMFQQEYKTAEAEDPEQAMEYLEQHGEDTVIVLLSETMQAESVNELLKYIQETGLQEQIPVILIVDNENVEQEYDFAVADVICKPFQPMTVTRRVRNIMELYESKRHIEKLESEKEEEYSRQKAYYEQIEKILCDSICYRNAETMRHIYYVEAYTRILAEHYAGLFPRARMTASKIDMIARAARMHDVGKLLLPDFIVASPGRLTNSELEILKEHTELGSQIMKILTEFQSERFQRICQNVCRYHHEKYDGSGYPEGLQKEKIPLEAQIVALADMYDVLINAIVGGEKNTKERAYYMLMNGECGELSPRMRESLKDAKEEMEAFSLKEDLEKAGWTIENYLI